MIEEEITQEKARRTISNIMMKEQQAYRPSIQEEDQADHPEHNNDQRSDQRVHPHIETWDESRAMQATTQACMELLRKAERRVKNSTGKKRSRDHKSGITHQESEHHTTEKNPQVC